MRRPPSLGRLRREGNPLIDGETVTFLWQGASAPQLLDDLHGWEDGPQTLKRVAPGLWAVSFDLPPDAYLEYAFADAKTKTRLPDNRRMQPILHEKGYEVTYRESGGAHNFTTWRDGLARGLESLFGA